MKSPTKNNTSSESTRAPARYKHIRVKINESIRANSLTSHSAVMSRDRNSNQPLLCHAPLTEGTAPPHPRLAQ